jgi:hypothetical protein
MSAATLPSILSSLYLSSAFKAGDISTSPRNMQCLTILPSNLSPLSLSWDYKAGNFSFPDPP